MSFLLLEALLKARFQDASNKSKPLIKIKADQWYVISKIRFVLIRQIRVQIKG